MGGASRHCLYPTPHTHRCTRPQVTAMDTSVPAVPTLSSPGCLVGVLTSTMVNWGTGYQWAEQKGAHLDLGGCWGFTCWCLPAQRQS